VQASRAPILKPRSASGRHGMVRQLDSADRPPGVTSSISGPCGKHEVGPCQDRSAAAEAGRPRPGKVGG